MDSDFLSFSNILANIYNIISLFLIVITMVIVTRGQQQNFFKQIYGTQQL